MKIFWKIFPTTGCLHPILRKFFENFLKIFPRKKFFSSFPNGLIWKVNWLKSCFEDILKNFPYYRIGTAYTWKFLDKNEKKKIFFLSTLNGPILQSKWIKGCLLYVLKTFPTSGWFSRYFKGYDRAISLCKSVLGSDWVKKGFRVLGV